MRTWDMNLLSGAAVWRLGFLRPFLAMVDRLFAEDERKIHVLHKCRSNKRALKDCRAAYPYSGGLDARTFDRLRSDALRRYAMDGQIYGVEVPQDLCTGSPADFARLNLPWYLAELQNTAAPQLWNRTAALAWTRAGFESHEQLCNSIEGWYMRKIRCYQPFTDHF